MRKHQKNSNARILNLFNSLRSFYSTTTLSILLLALICYNLYNALQNAPISQPDSNWVLPHKEEPTLSEIEHAKYKIDPNTLYNQIGSINVWDIYPPNANCLDLIRLGNIGDGGKWVCGVSHGLTSVESKATQESGSRQACIVYSFGISFDISFETALLKHPSLNCKVHAFDPTVGKLPPVPQELLVDQKGEKRITFHKVALGTTSRSSEPTGTHLLSEHLYDLMRMHGHSHIDLLKMDIEGMEWEVMEDLVARLPSSSLMSNAHTTLPIRQILIELHYQDSLERIDRFFSSMKRIGFVVTSREINLQPSSVGKPPLAVEYVLVNTRMQHAQNLDSMLSSSTAHAVPKVVPAAASLSSNKLRAVLYILTQKSRMKRLMHALDLLYDNFLSEYPYPVVIIHDDFHPSDIALVRQHSKIRELIFAPIKLSIPTEIIRRNLTIPDRTRCSPAFSSIGYRHMCHFHSTLVHDLLPTVPGVGDAEYIMRLDDDSNINAPIGYDPFELMRRHGKMYGIVNHLLDDPLCVEGLWNITRDFVAAETHHGRLNGSDIFSSTSTSSFFGRLPERYTFYNNFEISHISLWRSPVWKSYMKNIENIGGIYTHRWGDAPIHTIGVSLMLPVEKLHRFTDIAYAHAPFIDQQPSGLPRPSNSPLYSKDDYACTFFDQWRCNTTASMPAISNKILFSLPNKPAWVDGAFERSAAVGAEPVMLELEPRDMGVRLPTVVSGMRTRLPFKTSLGEANGSADNRFVKGSMDSLLIDSPQSSNSNSLASNPGKNQSRSIALYTFAHGGSEKALGMSVSSFYRHFVQPLTASSPMDSVSIFIFHSKKGTFRPQVVIQALYEDFGKNAAWIKNSCSFVPVVIRMPSAKQVQAEAVVNTTGREDLMPCLATTGELRGASYFLRRNAPAALARRGYSWLFRFGLDSRLHGPVSVDLFSTLETSGHNYAYVGQVLDSSKCVGAVWESALSYCEGIQSGRISSAQISSSVPIPMDRTQPLTGIKKNNLCSKNILEWPKHVIFYTNFEISAASVWRSPLCHGWLEYLESTDVHHEDYGDAAIHTLCVLMSLSASQIKRLTGIKYESRFTFFNEEKNREKGSGMMVDSITSAAASSHSTAETPSTPSSQSDSSAVGGVYTLTPIPALNKLFEPQRFGWLGGDVAASFVLPSLSQLSQTSASSSPETIKFLWLFGDSLIGTSSASMRLEGKMVSNTVGVATLRPSRVGSTVGPAGLESTRTNGQSEAFSIRYYWSMSAAGAPGPVFALNSAQPFYGDNTKFSFWPIAGISVMVQTARISTVNVLILGPLVRQSLDALGFTDMAAALFVVANPHDAPSDWEYKSKVFKNSGEGGRFKWVSLNQGDGAQYAVWNTREPTSRDDWLYLYGIYSPHTFKHQDYDLFGLQARGEYQVVGRIRVSHAVSLELDALEVLLPQGKWVLAHEILGARSSGEARNSRALMDAREKAISPFMMFQPSVSEMSLHYTAAGWRLFSLKMLENKVRLCSSQSVTGRFSCHYTTELPPSFSNAEYMTYAAKGHPELLSLGMRMVEEQVVPSKNNSAQSSSSGKKQSSRAERAASSFIVSVVSNPANGPGELFRQPKHRDAYCPKFFLVTLEHKED